jgi:hypothetical protein
VIKLANGTVIQEIVKEYADYSQFVNMMTQAGWIRKQKSIDELTTSVVQTFSTVAGGNAAQRVVDVTCPAGYIITTKGVEQIPAGADRGSAHALTLRLAGTDGTEMDQDVKVKMEIIAPFEDTKLITRDFYSMYALTKQLGTAVVAKMRKGDNEIYRWRRGFALYTQEIFRISVINPDIAVDGAHVKIQMDLDFWYKQV